MNQAIDRITECDIQAIAITQSEYYSKLRGRFENTLKSFQNVQDAPEEQVPSPMTIEGDVAKGAMFSIVRSLKRSNGHGG